MKSLNSFTIPMLAVSFMLMLTGCSTEPEAINYGSDQCHYCKMTVVDLQHSAQYVSDKGKQFKYDAIECLVNEMGETKPKNPAHVLVADYLSPGDMVYTHDAHFVITEAIKSPMGANLSAFSHADSAKKVIESHGGELYNWEQLFKILNEE
ncbi:MAG: nitrous oxide reductase accessory protein NosL [Bacteroidia bacterium]